MKTKSIMLIAVSLGFGLVAAIGMSQVLGQKNGDAKKVEMTQVFVALVPLEIGDGLNEDNLKVSRRPVTEVPENSISSFEELKNGANSSLLLVLKYTGKDRVPKITNIQRVSKPGLRVYKNAKKMPRVLGGFGTAIISTSKGVMTNLKARELGIGGEVLCYIW